MDNSWDEYYRKYTDWDEAHCFNIRIELQYENELIKLGYDELQNKEDLFILEQVSDNKLLPQNRQYVKNERELKLSFEVPYDWSIDSDWEDRALILLGLKQEWVIDSSVEDS